MTGSDEEVDASARTPTAPFQTVATRAPDGTVHVRAPDRGRRPWRPATGAVAGLLALGGSVWLFGDAEPEPVRISLERGTEVTFRGAWGIELPTQVTAQVGDRLRVVVPFRGGHAVARLKGPGGRLLLDAGCPTPDARCVAGALRAQVELLGAGEHELTWIRSPDPVPPAGAEGRDMDSDNPGTTRGTLQLTVAE